MFQFFQTNYSIFSKLSLIIAMAMSVLEKIMPTFWNRQIVMVYKKKHTGGITKALCGLKM